MNKIIISSALIVMLSACGITRDDLGLEKQSPDEMLVVSRAPLSLPPEFNLRPIIEDNSITEKPELSAGEQALLQAVK